MMGVADRRTTVVGRSQTLIRGGKKTKRKVRLRPTSTTLLIIISLYMVWKHSKKLNTPKTATIESRYWLLLLLHYYYY